MILVKWELIHLEKGIVHYKKYIHLIPKEILHKFIFVDQISDKWLEKISLL